MSDPIEDFLAELQRYRELSAPARDLLLSRAAVLAAATTADVRALLATLERLDDELPPESNAGLAPLARTVLAACGSTSSGEADSPWGEPFDRTVTGLVRELYGRPNLASSQGHLLRLLATDAGPTALETFADLLAEQPPSERTAIDQAFIPLFQRPLEHAECLFPRLLDALAHPELAAVVLDTANYVTRERYIAAHPARDQVQRLAQLLGELTQHLQAMTERPPAPRDAMAVQEQLATTTALFISLCDALGLIGDPSVAHRLHPALELGHRRLQTEAAAALARLGEESGFEALVRLAAEPVVRNRVRAYLDELGQLDRMPAEFQGEVALAEGQLASWLALPTQFGMGPHEIGLVDRRTLFWPGYEQAVDCFLFSYGYEFAAAQWSGVGLVGPVTYASAADLEHLTPVDIYATYAGWHAEHAEIFEVPAAQVPDEQHADDMLTATRLQQQGYDAPELVLVGYLLGQRLPVFSARHAGEPGTVVVDGTRIAWYPAANPRQPVRPLDAYHRHKGRKLLENFNADLGD